MPKPAQAKNSPSIKGMAKQAPGDQDCFWGLFFDGWIIAAPELGHASLHVMRVEGDAGQRLSGLVEQHVLMPADHRLRNWKALLQVQRPRLRQTVTSLSPIRAPTTISPGRVESHGTHFTPDVSSVCARLSKTWT